jgi:Mrp family chromosome partitioning ATPase/uncharacterized protein involved in exopolysaccharide biosynthesis
MEPIAYLRAVQRRWRIIALAVLGGILLAWLSMGVDRLSGSRAYRASTTLITGQAGSSRTGDSKTRTQTGSSSTSKSASGSSQTSSGTQTLIALVKIDAVSTRVAKEIGYTGPVSELARRIDASVDGGTGFLTISARAEDKEKAKQFADAYATQLIAYLIDSESQSNTALANGLANQMNRIRQDVKALDTQINRYPDVPAPTAGKPQTTTRRTSGADPLIEQRNAALRQLGLLSQQYQEIRSRVPDSDGLEIIRHATITGTVTRGLPLPSSFAGRAAIGVFLGLLGGIALALLRYRFDQAIETTAAAEHHFGYPVLAEIPYFRKAKVSAEGSMPMPRPVADAYRLLSASLNENEPGKPPRSRAILVTSAGAGEGRTSVVAGLAAKFGEVGRTVLVLSCDFRQPEVHENFGIPNERGLAEALRSSNGGVVLADYIWYTQIPGVWFVPSGRVDPASDVSLASPAMRTALAEARQKWDVVLIDTPPVVTSDMTFLLPQVDSVLIVACAGQTRPDLAERSGELLKRLHAPVLGVVLTGERGMALPREYYRDGSRLRSVSALPSRVIHRAASAFGGLLRRARTVVSRVRRRDEQPDSSDGGIPPLPRHASVE